MGPASMALSRTKYPILADYLDALPNNLRENAHLGVTTRSDYSMLLLKRAPSLLQLADLPAPVRYRIGARWTFGEWIPATTYAMLCALAKDTVWSDDRVYHENMFELATEMYRTPANKFIMLLLSPTLMMKGAAFRWNHFHQGTTLKVATQSRTEVLFELNFPDHLFTDIVLRSLSATFCAAVAGAGASNAKAVIEDLKPTQAHVRISWN